MMRAGVTRPGGAAALVVAAMLAPAGARAQVRRAGQGGVDMQARLDAFVQRQSLQPRMQELGLAQGASMGRVSTGLGATMWGLGAGLDMVISDRYIVPLLGLGTSFTLGHYPTVYATAGDHVVEMHPWTAWQLDFLLPGFGMRWKHRRWMGGFLAQGGLNATFMTMQRSDESESRMQAGVNGLIRVTVEGCRRLDPESRVCLFGGPNVLLGSWFNGALMGVRMEYGR